LTDRTPEGEPMDHDRDPDKQPSDVSRWILGVENSSDETDLPKGFPPLDALAEWARNNDGFGEDVSLVLLDRIGSSAVELDKASRRAAQVQLAFEINAAWLDKWKAAAENHARDLDLARQSEEAKEEELHELRATIATLRTDVARADEENHRLRLTLKACEAEVETARNFLEQERQKADRLAERADRALKARASFEEKLVALRDLREAELAARRLGLDV